MAKPPQFIADFSKTGRPALDGRFDAPAFHRNRDPIWDAIKPLLDDRNGEALEVGSGTGQHVAAFARISPNITWFPSDHIDAHLTSINGWRQASGLANIAEPKRIDLSDPAWAKDLGRDRFVAVVCINVLHIAPWKIAENLFASAAQILLPDGKLVVYGPFKRDGAHTAPSNAEFDASLRAGNPEWGLRDIADLVKLGESTGLTLAEIIAMPANNFTLVFSRAR